jgi:hypothetical protein
VLFTIAVEFSTVPTSNILTVSLDKTNNNNR